MLLSEYIARLKAIQEEHGDLSVIYAIDEEGNGFGEVVYHPGTVLYDGNDIYDSDEDAPANAKLVVIVN